MYYPLGALILALTLTSQGVRADYDCLCSYAVETPMYTDADSSSQPAGYMYEFDCKPVATGYSAPDGWNVIQSEHMLVYVHMTSSMHIQICQGSVPDEDKLTTVLPTSSTLPPPPTTSTTTTTTMKPTPSTSTTTTRQTTTSTQAPDPMTTSSTTLRALTSSTASPSTSTATTSSTTLSTTSIPTTTSTTSTLTTTPTTTVAATTRTEPTTASTTVSTQMPTTRSTTMAVTSTTPSTTPTTTTTTTPTTSTTTPPTTTPTTTTTTTTPTPSTSTRTPTTTTVTANLTTTDWTLVPFESHSPYTTHAPTTTPSTTTTTSLPSSPHAKPTYTKHPPTVTPYYQSTPSTPSTPSTVDWVNPWHTTTDWLHIWNTTHAHNNHHTTSSSTFSHGNLDLCPRIVAANNGKEDIVQFRNKCLELVIGDDNWFNAEDDCFTTFGHGGELVEIPDQDTQTFIMQFLNDRNFHRNIWIGLHDMQREEHFRWDSGAHLQYTNWYPNRKNNNAPHGVEDCVYMKPNGQWDDAECDGGYMFNVHKFSWICQYPTHSPHHGK